VSARAQSVTDWSVKGMVFRKLTGHAIAFD
jgi:hypothetical protein